MRVRGETQTRAGRARSDGLTALAPHLSRELLPEALAAAKAIGDESHRVRALAALIEHLPPDQREEASSEALDAASAIGDDRKREDAVAALGHVLPPSLFPKAVALALTSGNDFCRADTLAKLAPSLPSELLADTIAATLAMERGGGEAKSRALEALVPRLPPQLLPEVILSVAELESFSGHLLATVASRLSRDLFTRVLCAAWETGHGWRGLIGEEEELAEQLAERVGRLPSDLRSLALSAAKKCPRAWFRAEILTALAPVLPPEQRLEAASEALAAEKLYEDEYETLRGRRLGELGKILPPTLLAEALDWAKTFRLKDRVLALSGLAPYLPSDLLNEALTAARETNIAVYRAEALTDIVQYLPSEQRRQVLVDALSAVKEIPREETRKWTLVEVASKLPSDLIGETLLVAKTFSDQNVRLDVLTRIAPLLPPPLLSEALTAAKEIGDKQERLYAVVGLCPFLRRI